MIKPSFDLRQRCYEVAIPGAVIGAHALLDERVRRVQRQDGSRRASTTGPVQSCGATGRCQASAIAAILRASDSPPHQEMIEHDRRRRRRSREDRGRPSGMPSVSEAQIGAVEASA